MIYKFFIISSLSLTVYCQFSSTTPSPHPPAQVHYVNIGADLAGDYKFGYDTGKGPSGQSFREETRSADGTVRGAYGYTDANNQQRIVRYSAGKDGFKIEDDSPAPSSGGSGSGSAPTPAPYRPPQTLPPQIYRPPQTLPPQTYRPQSPPAQSYRPQSPPPQTYRPPSDNSYVELNARPVQTYRAPAPAQTLRQILPSSYSSPSSSSLSSGVSYGGALSSGNSGSSSISYPPSQPSLQTYRPPAQASRQAAPAYSQPALRTYSGLATTPRPEEETWGPPVINTALLSYNIGAQGSLPRSYLSTSSSSSQPVRTYREPSSPPSRMASPVYAPASTQSINAPILRSYTSLPAATKPMEENWGPPVINTALLNYNIGSQQG